MKKILLSSALITICLGIGRIFGFVRDIAITNFFGQTYAADMAVLILTTQDLLLNFFLGNAFPLALMSVFVGKDDFLRQIIYKLHKMFAVGLLIILGVIIFNIHHIVFLLSPGLPHPYSDHVSQYLIISMISLPITVYAAIISSGLNFSGSFVVPALGNIIFNITICLSIFLCWMFSFINPFYSIAVGVVLGAVFRWVIQLWSLPTSSSKLFSSDPSIEIDKKSFFFHYLKALFSTSLIFVVPILARALASTQGMGQISIFNFISKIIDLPIMLISGAIVTVLTPMLIKNSDKEKTILHTCIFLFLSFSILSIFLYFFSGLIVQTLLNFGSFSQQNLELIIDQLKTASLMLPFYSVAFFLATAMATTKFAKVYPILCVFSGIFLYVYGVQYIEQPTHLYLYLISNYAVFAFLGAFLIIADKASCFFKEETSQC